MSKSVNLVDLQNILYVWLSKFEKRSLEDIKVHCNFLNESYDLNLSQPIWSIFWPLVFNGIVDYVGNGYYALVTPMIIDYDTHYVYINCRPDNLYKQLAVGVYLSDELTKSSKYRIIKVNPLSILKSFPSVKDIVDSFPKSLCKEENLRYYNKNARKGIARLASEGIVRYFSIPEKLYMREIPDRNINPEAFAIAYCYSRAINNESNGLYKKERKLLALPVFALPYLLYRTLLLYSLSNKIMPEVDGKYYYFSNLTKIYIEQLNRIFCNSIAYE